ncbi:MAG: gluconate 2-dehydrogenase subunit 3 family protein [Candidatus Binatia bacterium]|nr:gluconate 2-dehydrogenase subunit 3 family protein [Candidatus Binatia bacterium]
MKQPDCGALAFTAEEQLLLAAVLDTLIPASDDGRFPAAGALGCGPSVIEGCNRIPGLLQVVRDGLRELARLSTARYGQPFAALDGTTREQLLAEQGFVFPLLMQTYIAYYRHPAVLAALGLEPRPPHPKGYALAEPAMPVRPKA